MLAQQWYGRHLQRRAEEELILVYRQTTGGCYNTLIPNSDLHPTMTNNTGSQVTVTSSVYLSAWRRCETFRTAFGATPRAPQLATPGPTLFLGFVIRR